MPLSDVCLTFDVYLSRTSGLSREQRGLGRPKLAQRYATWAASVPILDFLRLCSRLRSVRDRLTDVRIIAQHF